MFKNYLLYYDSTTAFAEFESEKLKKYENVPNVPGQRMKHQEVISNIMNGGTNIERLLLVHDMGTGKTCTAISAIETNFENKMFGMKKAIILNRGKSILNNFYNELVTKCTTNYFSSGNEKAQRALVNKKYQLTTFELFSKSIENLSKKTLIEQYNNTFLVIDEVHNILNENSLVYKEIYRFINSLPSIKVLLLTGTPIKDSPEDFLPILNLLVPKDLKISLQNFRNNLYTNGEPNETFRSLVSNKISYLRSIDHEVPIHYVGKILPGLKHFVVVSHEMSDFQKTHYIKALNRDLNENSGVYNFSRQASRFVFPDGSFGSEGYHRFVVDRQYNFTQQMKKHLNKYGTDRDSVLKCIKEMSVKYEYIIKSILAADSRQEKTIVYDDLVKGSGLVILSMLLSFIGFKKHRILTAETTQLNEISKIQKIFNDDVTGDKISTILGSKVISEGYTFLDVIHEHVVPHWNNTETEQVIARGIRMGSHRKSLMINPQTTVNVYKHVVIYNNDFKKSVDYLMVKYSEEKDIEIKKILNLLRESSITCKSFLERNGGKCFYPNKIINYDNVPILKTYDKTLIDKIKLYFSNKRFSTFDEVYKHFSSYDKNIILSCLYNIIYENNGWITYSGLKLYLHENNNYIYASTNIVFSNDLFSSLYIDDVKPTTGLKHQEMYKEILDDNTPNIHRVLEIALTCKLLNIGDQNKVNEILENKSKYFTLNYEDNYAICSYNENYINIPNSTTCLINPQTQTPWLEWTLCPKVFKTKITSTKNDELDQFENSIVKRNINYYGQRNPDTQDFCIKEILMNKFDDTRKQASGKRCVNWSKNDIIQISKKLNINLESDKMTRVGLCKLLEKEMEKKDLIVESRSCGVQNKRKK